MNRQSEAALLDFCVRQHEEFEAEAWVNHLEHDRRELAAVALFLAGVDWFGYRRELIDIAEQLHSGCVGRFSDLARLTQFDCARFSNLLRRQLTLTDHAPTSS